MKRPPYTDVWDFLVEELPPHTTSSSITTTRPAKDRTKPTET